MKSCGFATQTSAMSGPPKFLWPEASARGTRRTVLSLGAIIFTTRTQATPFTRCRFVQGRATDRSARPTSNCLRGRHAKSMTYEMRLFHRTNRSWVARPERSDGRGRTVRRWGGTDVPVRLCAEHRIDLFESTCIELMKSCGFTTQTSKMSGPPIFQWCLAVRILVTSFLAAPVPPAGEPRYSGSGPGRHDPEYGSGRSADVVRKPVPGRRTFHR